MMDITEQETAGEKMYLLAIETTGPQLSVATIDEEGKVREEKADEGFNHLTNLMPLIDKITKENALAPEDAAAIAVSRGPGSFTGIRIGVSTARALAQALGLKAVAVPTLESFVYHAPEFKGAICPIFDARRSQVYGGAYAWCDSGERIEGETGCTGSEGEKTGTGRAYGRGADDALMQKTADGRAYMTLVPGGAYTFDEYIGLLKEALVKAGIKEIMAFGDGMRPCGERFKEFAASEGLGFIDARDAEAPAVQSAASVARLGLDLYREGKACSFEELLPDYMRKAEAERKLEEKRAANAGR